MNKKIPRLNLDKYNGILKYGYGSQYPEEKELLQSTKIANILQKRPYKNLEA